jgi:2-polyprenyl-3-methyl-5-hydroxy-6-metoxy-1,4-benzoquinol methylase
LSSQLTYNADWYDEVMVEKDSPAMEPLATSPWLTTYERVAAMIDANEEVVDLGCGTGRFIRLLHEREHYGRITGVDWSMKALAEAKRYARRSKSPDAPKPTWKLSDLMEWRADGLRAGNTVFTCMEVLEHLEDDLGFVRRVPPGHRFIITVPNFYSESHVRIFQNVGEIWERYAGLLMFRSWSMVGSERQGIHVCETRRREDSW